MTITRDDLECAAKAAGIEGEYDEESQIVWYKNPFGDAAGFNPCRSREDAFDLAMKCGMYIDFFGGFVGASTGEERRFTPHNHAECCEAIVLAAAEIWRNRK